MPAQVASTSRPAAPATSARTSAFAQLAGDPDHRIRLSAHPHRRSGRLPRRREERAVEARDPRASLVRLSPEEGPDGGDRPGEVLATVAGAELREPERPVLGEV